MQVTESMSKYIKELGPRVDEDQIVAIKRMAKEISDAASSEENANATFLMQLYQNYREEIKGTSAGSDALKLLNSGEAESYSPTAKPSDEAFLKALGVEDLDDAFDWSRPGHWSKMPVGDFQARMEEAGIDPRSALAWLNQRQIARDRQMIAEGYDPQTGDLPRANVFGVQVPNPLPWLGSAAMGLMAPRTKAAIAQGREPTWPERLTDIGVNAAQALPIATFAAPVSLAGKAGLYALANAGVPVAEEIADYFTSEDPYRKEVSPANIALGTAVNIGTPIAIRQGARAIGNAAKGFAAKAAPIGKKIEEFVSDPVQANKEYLRKAQETVDKGMAPEGSGFVDPAQKLANAQEYEDALDVLVLDDLRKKGFFVPEMSDPKARKKLVEELLVHSEQDPEVMLKSDITRRGLRGIGKEAPGTYAKDDLGNFKTSLDEKFYSVNPSYSSVYAASKEAGAKSEKDLANLGAMEEFGTVLVDGQPRLAIFDPSIEPSLGNTSRIKDFKKKYGYDPEERHFPGKKHTAAAQFKASDPLYEGADVLAKPTEFDKALGKALEKPENKQLAFFGSNYKPGDRARLGMIGLGTNKLGKSENAKRIPGVGQDIYNIVEKDIATNQQEQNDIEYYLSDPATIRQWEAGFKPRIVNGSAMIKAYEIWKASKEKGNE